MALEVEGFGTTLASATIDTFATPSTITKMIDFEPPNVDIEALPVRTFSSTNQTETYQPGWKKPQKGKCTILFQHTLVATIEALIGTTVGWVATYPDGSTRKFNGFIIKAGEKVPLAGLLTYTFEIQATGAVTFTAGTS